jgi:hypothetical protein
MLNVESGIKRQLPRKFQFIQIPEPWNAYVTLYAFVTSILRMLTAPMVRPPASTCSAGPNPATSSFVAVR